MTAHFSQDVTPAVGAQYAEHVTFSSTDVATRSADPGLIDALARARATPTEEVIDEVAAALRARLVCSSDAMNGALRSLRRLPHWAERLAVVRALGSCRVEGSEAARFLVVARSLVEDPVAAVRHEAATALADVDGVRALAALRARLTVEPDAAVRATIEGTIADLAASL